MFDLCNKYQTIQHKKSQNGKRNRKTEYIFHRYYYGNNNKIP